MTFQMENSILTNVNVALHKLNKRTLFSVESEESMILENMALDLHRKRYLPMQIAFEIESFLPDLPDDCAVAERLAMAEEN